jgi:hypothetical protein
MRALKIDRNGLPSSFRLFNIDAPSMGYSEDLEREIMNIIRQRGVLKMSEEYDQLCEIEELSTASVIAQKAGVLHYHKERERHDYDKWGLRPGLDYFW